MPVHDSDGLSLITDRVRDKLPPRIIPANISLALWSMPDSDPPTPTCHPGKQLDTIIREPDAGGVVSAASKPTHVVYLQ